MSDSSPNPIGPDKSSRRPMRQSEPACLDKLMDDLAACLTPEVAHRIVQLRPHQVLQEHVCRFASKSEQGLLSAGELAEYRTIVRFAKFLSVLQSKARVLLRTDAEIIK